MQSWPESLYDFAFIPPTLVDRLPELADKAEPEDWKYESTSFNHDYPILYSYIQHTYRRVAEERKISLSDNGDFSCFNTGLVTSNQEAIYAEFEVNRREEAKQQWFFKGWFRRGEWELNVFSSLPELPNYIDDPADLVLDTRKSFRVDIEHIIEKQRERFPEPFDTMNDFMLRNILDGAIASAKDRTRRNYKTAVPQYFNGRVQLLLPLCLSNPQRADLALVIESHDSFYRATTCLTLNMAYNNARLLARPDRDWLQP